MVSRKILMATAILAASTSAVFAIPFDNTSGAAAVATVGVAGDYATLGAAAIAFNGVAGGINREWTLSILESTTEAANVGFANSFGVGGKLIIKPAASATPTITFTQATAQATSAFFGHLIFGSYAIDITGGPNVTPDLTNTIASNGNYVIDGSNTDGGTTRDLTITAGETVAFASAANNLIRVVGDTDGIVIKNANIVFNDTGGTATALGLAGCVIAGNNLAPDDATIQNNLISSSTITGTTANGAGVGTTLAASGTIPAGTIAIQNLTVVDNTINVNQRGVFQNGVGTATISRNVITIANSGTATATQPIFHFTSNGVSGWTQTYDRNEITTESNANTITPNVLGAYGILSDSAPTTGTYSITNNVIKGNFCINPLTNDYLARGISLASVTSAYTIEHNSISVPPSSANGVTGNRLGGIVLPLAMTTGTVALKNNIVRLADADGASAAIRLAAATGVTAEGNNIVAPGGRVANVAGTEHVDLAAWQGAGFDLVAGQSVDPTTTSPAWDADLRFAEKPISGLSGVNASTTLFDIDGDARPATGAIPGAHEPDDAIIVPVLGAESWESYM